MRRAPRALLLSVLLLAGPLPAGAQGAAEAWRVLAEVFRIGMARDASGAIASLTAARNPAAQTLASGLGGAVPAMWEMFFSGAVVLVPPDARDDRATIGFYNPFTDGFVITDWQSDAPPRLTALAIATGDQIRNGTAAEGADVPEWVSIVTEADVPAVAALALSMGTTVERFQSAAAMGLTAADMGRAKAMLELRLVLAMLSLDAAGEQEALRRAIDGTLYNLDNPVAGLSDDARAAAQGLGPWTLQSVLGDGTGAWTLMAVSRPSPRMMLRAYAPDLITPPTWELIDLGLAAVAVGEGLQ